MKGITAWLLLGALCLASCTVAQDTAWEKYMDAAKAAFDRGEYPEAEKQLLIALNEAEKFKEQDPRLAISLNALGMVYDAQGKYAKAEPHYRRALAIREKALGPDHPDVATSLNNLAALSYAQGKYAEAEPHFRRALAIQEKALGPDHPDVASSLNNLAELYRAQGKYAEAKRLHGRSLAIREKALGPEHPDVATSVNNLAELYRDQGQYAETEPLFRRALAIVEKALGLEHPNVARRLNNLALLYSVQGKYAEAEPLFERSLAIDEKALGPEHPGVAADLNNLALLHHDQGKYAKAEPLFRRALAIQEKALGPKHPNVATTLENYAKLLRKTNREAEAAELEARAQAIRDKHARKNPTKSTPKSALRNFPWCHRRWHRIGSLSIMPHTVSILGGTGAEGFGLALRWAQAGVPVRIGSRDAEKANAAAARVRQAVPEAQADGQVQGLLNPEAAAQSDVVVLTVPLAAQIPIVKSVRNHLRPGTIFVDATVPSGTVLGDRIAHVVTPWAGSAAQQAAAYLPAQVRIVSAFHCLSAVALADLSHPVDSDVLVCGDSLEAKAVLKELVEKIAGARAIDAGPLENSRFAENVAALLISLNLRHKVKYSGVRITGIRPGE